MVAGMRALVVTENGPPGVLRVEERPDPVAERGEVRIRVRAAGVSFAELMARMGAYRDAPKTPCVLGYEVAGEIDSVGEGVDGLAAGDRVMAGCRFGGQAELVTVGAEQVLPLPEGWSFEEGAALPVNYATAYAAIVRYGALLEGERVLIHAAAGGVGIAATQIAKACGGEVFGTASSPKHDAIRRLGVDHPIDYRAGSFVRAVRRMTGERRPLDLVLDVVGGRSFRQSFSLLRTGGRLVCAGVSSMISGERRNLPAVAKTLVQTPWFSPLTLASQSKSVIGLNLLALWDAKGTIDELVMPLRELIESSGLRPVVSGSFPLERAAEAHRLIHERRNVGKVVLTV